MQYFEQQQCGTVWNKLMKLIQAHFHLAKVAASHPPAAQHASPMNTYDFVRVNIQKDVMPKDPPKIPRFIIYPKNILNNIPNEINYHISQFQI